MGQFLNIVAGAVASVAVISSVSAQSVSAQSVSSEIRADAASRPSLVAAEAGAGHDEGGFYISGANGFRLNIGGDTQFRYTANMNQGDTDEFAHGFTSPMTRLRLSGEGHGFDYGLTATFRNESDFGLENAYAGRKFGESHRAQFGQFQLPFLREDGLDDRFQMAAAQSITSSVFGQGYSQGVQWQSRFGDLSLIAAVSDGFNTANTDFNSPVEQDFALTFRAEYMFMGVESAFRDFSSLRTDGSSLMVGAAGHYEDGDTQTMYTYTGDISYERSGFSVFGAGIGRNIEMAGDSSFNDFGIVAQSSYRLTDSIEIFGRFDSVLPDDDRGLNDAFNFATAGVNYYFGGGHAVKMTGDVVYAFDETTGLSSLGGFGNSGLLGSDEAGEIALRLQFQVSF